MEFRPVALLLGLTLAACGRGQPPASAASPAGSTATAPTGTGLPVRSTAGPAQSPAPTAASGNTASSTAVVATPDFARGEVQFKTAGGLVMMPVEIADDEAKREYGLMNRHSLPPDAGMIFVFRPPADPVQIGFWMKDTFLPLSIAFVEPNLTVESLQDMEPQTENIHYAPRPYIYAIEANKGYFVQHHIVVGDSVLFSPAPH